MKRTFFGIHLLDSLIDNGFPHDSFIVLSGPVGVGKSFALKRIIASHLSSGERIVVVSFDNDPKDIVEYLKSNGINRLDDVVVVDGFGDSSHDLLKHGVGDVVALDTLNRDTVLSSLEIVLRSSKPSLMAIDSLNEIALSLDPMSVISFIKTIKKYSRKYNTLIIAVFHTGIPGFEQIESLIYYLVDGVIIMDFDPRFSEIGLPLRRIRILKLRDTRHEIGWVLFQITDSGLEPVDVKALLAEIKKAASELGVQGK